MKKLTACLLAAAVLLALGACAHARRTVRAPDRDSPLTFCLGARPETLDPARGASGVEATYLVNLFAGLTGYRLGGDGEPELSPELCRALPVAEARDDGTAVYTFALRDGLQWSDGTALTAADFVYAWNRASAQGAADPYLFDSIARRSDGTLDVTASDDGGTLTVVLTRDAPYFLELCASPSYLPVQRAAVESGADWASGAERLVCSGAYRVGALSDTQLVMTKNPHYWDAENVVTETLVFDFTDDPAAALEGFLSSRYALVEPLPAAQLPQLQADCAEEYRVTSGLGVYSLCFNANDSALSGFSQTEREQLRMALSLLIDRNYICTQIAQAGQIPANAYIPAGVSDADGSDFAGRNGPDGKGGGYYSTAAEDYEANCAKAVALLREAAASSGLFTVNGEGVCSGFPALTYLTSDAAGHVAIADYLKTLWAGYGIELTVSVQDMEAFLASRASGAYSIVRSSWSADYDDPVSFLALWTSGAGSNEIGLGRGVHADYAGYSAALDGEARSGLTWAESYDALLYRVRSTSDAAARYELMHQAESLLMQTGVICPLYEYTETSLQNTALTGVIEAPTGARYLMFAQLQ